MKSSCHKETIYAFIVDIVSNMLRIAGKRLPAVPQISRDIFARILTDGKKDGISSCALSCVVFALPAGGWSYTAVAGGFWSGIYSNIGI